MVMDGNANLIKRVRRAILDLDTPLDLLGMEETGKLMADLMREEKDDTCHKN